MGGSTRCPCRASHPLRARPDVLHWVTRGEHPAATQGASPRLPVERVRVDGGKSKRGAGARLPERARGIHRAGEAFVEPEGR